MLLLDQFLADCRDAVCVGQSAVHDVVAQALADHERFDAAVRERAKPWFFVADDALTIFCTDGRGGSASSPHDHGVWSVLGCFRGAEESWWHELSGVSKASSGSGLTTIGSGVLRAGEAHALGADVIHSVMNRWDAPNAMVHVYGGNFLAMERSIWDPVTHARHPAGWSEPRAPLPGAASTLDAGTSPADDSPTSPLAGTAFVALAVDDVAAVAKWLTQSFGLQPLTTAVDTCAIDEQFTYLIEPLSLTVIGIHARCGNATSGLDHVALRVNGLSGLEQLRSDLDDRGAAPSPITQWQFGTFTEVVGPEGIRVRCFVPELRA
jgi:predicted metal-dependent enzyme (double-stranded beta helix superfamily)